MGCMYCCACQEELAKRLSMQVAGYLLHLLVVVQAVSGGLAVQVC